MGEAANGFSSEPALPLPRMLGRRILLRLVARGGMGDVYLGATTGIEGAERPCIVKTVRRDHVHDGSFLARFLDEARVQAQLQHPGVAQVLEAANDDNGEPYTVVEYVEGRSLSDARQRAIQLGVKIAWPEAVAVALEIAQALAHVHERPQADGSPLGIVHRDLSPQNVMVSYSGEVKLIDFGTARGHNRRCHTVAGVVFAKPGYVAPEVARQQVGDGRIDLYALGVMLWEMCAGRRFLSTDPQRHLDDAAAGKVVLPPVAKVAGAPLELDDIIAKLTKNDPDDRYPCASLTVPDLAKLLSAAPAGGSGERGIRPRLSQLMQRLWTHEPGRSRSEFARLLREARATLADATAKNTTPHAGSVSEALAQRMVPTDPSHLAGTPYRLARKIGEGASGVVWEAEHIELGRKIAIKVLAQEHASSPAALERFRREARAVAGLSHPNLVQILDFGKSLDGRIYLAMELCAGVTLDATLRKGALPWREAVSIAIDVCSALQAAHDAGLVHRDLKPENLVVTYADDFPAEVKLLDFGVATAMGGPDERPATVRERVLQGFAIFGTPEYMAPEQVAGEPLDGRTDLYGLGCVLYEMLTGVPAFEGPSSVVVMGKQLRETPAPPRTRAPARAAIPAAVESVVLCAMAKLPSARFANAGAMKEALQRTLASPGRRRARAKAVATAVVTGLCIAGAAVGSGQWAMVRAKAHADAQAAGVVSTPAASAWSLPSGPAGAPAPGLTVAMPALGIPSSVLSTVAAATPAPPATVSPPIPLRDARAAAKSRPTDPRALEAWARAAFRAGDLREARRAASSWALHDAAVEPRVLMAQVLDASGRRTDAIATLAEWLESHPETAPEGKAERDDAHAELARLSGEPSPHELARR